LHLQRNSDSAFDFTTLSTGDKRFSLDANVASKVESVGWELGHAGAPTAQQWVAALEEEAYVATAPVRLSGPLLARFQDGWQLLWFEVGGGSVRYYSSADEAKARTKPCEEFSLAGLVVNRKSDSAFDFTTLHTGDWKFSLDTDVASKVGSAGWELGPAGALSAQQWVAMLEEEANMVHGDKGPASHREVIPASQGERRMKRWVKKGSKYEEAEGEEEQAAEGVLLQTAQCFPAQVRHMGSREAIESTMSFVTYVARLKRQATQRGMSFKEVIGKRPNELEDWLSWQNDRGLVLVAVGEDADIAGYTSEELGPDREFVLNTVNGDWVGDVLNWASREMTDDQDVVIAALRPRATSLPVEAQNGRSFVLAAIARDTNVLAYASKELRMESKVVLTLVAQNGDALHWAAHELEVEREILLAAVGRKGQPLQWVHPDFQGEVCLAVVTETPEVLRWASAELWGDVEDLEAATNEAEMKTDAWPGADPIDAKGVLVS